MKHLLFTYTFLLLCTISTSAQIDVSKHVPGIKYESKYSFNICTETEALFYSKKGTLKSTIPYSTYYNSDFSHICISLKRGGSSAYFTIFDIPNNNIIILLGDINNLSGSAAVIKPNNEEEYRTLQLSKSEETKLISGMKCTKYIFDVSEFKGEMWITNELPDISNDLGVLKVSKLGKYYEKISATGFVMEITSITPKGKKTVVQTTGLFVNKPLEIIIPEDLGTALNKLDYFDY